MRSPRTAWLALLLALPAAAQPEHKPIRIHPANHRYFDWRGRATVLVASGEHYGSVINQDFDYRKYLATLQADGLNHTRIFLGDYVESKESFGIVGNPLNPDDGRLLAPWARSNTPGFARGGNKFDLDRWDPAFFDRLHAFFDEAYRKGVVVEGVLFFVGPGYEFSPFHPKNNVNSTTLIDNKRYLSLDSGNVLARQEQYTRKLVRELNRHPNLIINVCNEPWFFNQEKPGFVSGPPAEVKAWIQRVSEWVSSEESRLPAQHIMSVDVTNQGLRIPPSELTSYFSRIPVFNVHYDANAESLRQNPEPSRLWAFNETGFNGTADDQYRTQGWNYLLSGGGLYGNLDFSFTVGHEDGTAVPRFTGNYNSGGSAALRKQLKILLDFMHSLPLEKMQPDNGVIVGGADGWRALASPGQSYAVWLPGEGPIAPVIAIPPGEWRAEWVDIRTGAVTAQTFTQKSWISTLHGRRSGGGVALRVIPASSRPVSPPTIISSAPTVVEDFEGYPSNEAFTKIWYKAPHGSWVRQSLDPDTKSEGRFGLKVEHRVTDAKGQNYSAICIMKKWDLSGQNALQFWLKPDGSGRDITMQFNLAGPKGANIHDLWQATYQTAPGDSSPRIVTIPFSSLRQPGWLNLTDMNVHFQPADVIELAIYISAGAGHFGEGAFFIDDIRAVSLPQQSAGASFDQRAAAALLAMKQRAAELGIGGVAVVAWFEGERIESWSSQMAVVGRMKDLPAGESKGANLLGIAYAKASEMADTLQNSGGGVRKPMTGEFGWQGGVIARAGNGYVLAAFSGGKSEDDVKVSRAGIDVLRQAW